MSFEPKGEGEVRLNPVNMYDEIDRKKAKAVDKLNWICDRAKEKLGADPRGGGFSLVGYPNIVEQAFGELALHDRRLQQGVVIGAHGGDIVGWWVHRQSEAPLPFIVRHSALVEVGICVMHDSLIPESKPIDRKVAGEIRMAMWQGAIRVVS